MSESVCVLGSKSHSGCLPIIMMLLNPSLKLTLLSFSLVLYPPSRLHLSLFLSPSLTLSLHPWPLSHTFWTLSWPPQTPSPSVSPPCCIIIAYGSLLALQKPLAEISSGGARLSLSFSPPLLLSPFRSLALFLFFFWFRLAVAATLAEWLPSIIGPYCADRGNFRPQPWS